MDARIFERLAGLLLIAIATASENRVFAAPAGSTPLTFSTLSSVQNDTSHQTSSDPLPLTNGVATATSLYAGDDGTVSLSIAGGSSDNIQFASASITFEFIVFGPTNPIYPVPNIPLTIQGLGMLSTEDASSATSTENMATVSSSTIPGFIISDSVSNNQETGFGVNSFFYVNPNEVNSMTLALNAYSIGGKTASINATLDPLIQFENGFDSTGYSLVAAPVSPVPEPSASWLVLSGGLGLIGFRQYRTRSAAGLRFS